MVNLQSVMAASKLIWKFCATVTRCWNVCMWMSETEERRH